MKKISLLAAAITVVLTGCGSDDSSPSSTPISTSFTITAIDGYLYRANVYTGDNCDQFIDQTNQEGQLTLTNETINKKVCIKAVAGETIDMTRGVVVDDFALAAPENSGQSIIVSPMTNLVVEQINLASASNIEVTQEEAEQAVIDSFNTHEDVIYTHEDIFGDYIDAADGEGKEAEKAKTINIVGEALVDNNDVLEVNDQLQVIYDISEETSHIIADEEQELDNSYAPVIETGENGYVGIIPNNRPVTKEVSKPKTIDLGTSLNYALDTLFIDNDGDDLSYTVDASEAAGAAITTHTSMLTITPTLAGTYDVLAYASDEVSRSYPLVLKVTAVTPNTAPILNEQNTLQADLDALALTATVSTDERLSISGLFTDADNDPLIYAVTDVTESGLSINVNNANTELHVIGTPSQEGAFTFDITAYDGVHSAVSQTFTLNVTKAPNTPPILEPTQHQRVADDLTALELRVGTAVNGYINIEQLFSDDDELTLAVQDKIAGVETNIDGAILTLLGTPTEQGNQGYPALDITADDGVNTPVSAYFDIFVAEEDNVDPVDPVTPAPTPLFEEKHFIGGYWRMGEIGEDIGQDHDFNGDLEMGWASLLKEQEQHYFCWDKSLDIQTPEQLEELETPENKKLIISPNSEDCRPVDIQPDGTLLGEGKIYTPVYTSEKDGDYQIVFEIEGDLYWLDSTQDLPFTAMLPVPPMDKTVYQSIDWAEGSGVEVLLRSADFTVNEQNIYASEVTKSGTFFGRELDVNDPLIWIGTWEISKPGEDQELLSYDAHHAASYEQRYMRQFNGGELSILVAQHGDEVGEKVDIVLESNDLALLRRINAVWDPQPAQPTPLDPSLLEGKTFYFTENGASTGDGESLKHHVVWCDAVKFEDGNYYFSQRNPSNRTACPTDADLLDEGSYSIDEENSRLVVKNGINSATHTVIGDASDISQGALSVISNGERYTYFTDKSSVEDRLNAKSSTNGETSNSFGFYLPTEQMNHSQLGKVSISLTSFNANITFEKEIDGDEMSCEMIHDYFDGFWLSSGDSANYEWECSRDIQGIVSVNIPSRFALDTNTVYSVIGTSENNYQESIKYSIHWDEILAD
ncbi:hypothetical protein ACE1OE_20590 [Vibrio sp. E150_011]